MDARAAGGDQRWDVAGIAKGARGSGITGDQREFKGLTEHGLSGGVQSNLIDVFGIVGIDAPDA